MIELDMPIPAQAPQLRKNCLSFAENLSQAIGAMAPSGSVALTIPLAFASAGNATWLLYVLALGAYLLVGININEFASRTSSPGAIYHFSGLGLGRVAGVAAGWTYVFGLLFSISSPALTFAQYAILLCRMVPGLGIIPFAGFAFLCVAMVTTCWISCRDIRLSTSLILILECVSVGLMLVLAAIFLGWRSHGVDLPQLKLTGASLTGFRVGSILALFSMTGFESATTLGGESRKALQSIPRATLMCLLPVSFLLILMSYVLVACYRGAPTTLDLSEAPFDRLAAICGLPAFGHLINFGILLSFFACTLGGLNAAARVLYAMAQRGHFWRRAGVAHRTNATPHVALAVTGTVAIAVPAALMLSGISLDRCIDYTSQLGSFGFFVSYLFICVAAPVFLRREGLLKAKHVVVAAAGILVLSVPLLSFFYPEPEAPSLYFPYVFTGIVVAATLLSLRVQGPVPADRANTTSC
jgi:amino acid transporter